MCYPRALRVACGMATGLVILLSGTTGCALLNGFLDPTKVGQFPANYQERGIRHILTPRDTPPGLPNAAEPTPDDLVPIFADYRLSPGDAVAVIIQDLGGPGVPEQVVLEVSATGNLRIPQLGTVRVEGLSETELEQELVARLREAELLADPDVRVYAQTRRRRTFSVRGAVGAPGQYAISDPDTRLLDVVGLFQDVAATVPRFYVIRRNDEGLAADDTGVPVEPPPTPPTERFIVPPPEDADAEFQVNFYTAGAAERVAPPTEDTPEQAELEAVLAPETAPASRTATPLPSEPVLPPLLIFDPKTGEVVEPSPAAEPVVPAPESTTMPPVDTGEPFDWEALPEVELEQRVIEIDARALFAGDPKYNIVIRDRDVINVPVDTGVYYLMGEVARPGAFAFNGRDITIKQALASSGGFAPFAWPQRAEIIRHEPGTDKQLTIPVNLDAIFAGLDDDVYLRDDDIVNVGTHVVAPFLFVIRNSFRFTYGFGFVYDRNFADKDAYEAQINPQTLEITRRERRGLPF